MDTLSFSAYAKRIGVSQPYISQLVKSGVIPVTAERKIDPAVADAALLEHRDPAKQATVERHAAGRAAKGAPPPPAAAPSAPTAAPAPIGRFHQAKTATEVFKAKTAEMEYRERVGELVEHEKVTRSILDGLGPILSQLDSLSARLAPKLIGLTEVRQARDAVDDEVERMRQDIADTLRAMIAGRAGATKQ